MCGTEIGASLSSQTKLKANAKAKQTAYVGHSAGRIHAADASATATPVAATLVRTSADARLSGRRRAAVAIILGRLVLAFLHETQRHHLPVQRLPADPETLRRRLLPIAVL